MAQYIDKDILAAEIKRCVDDELQTIKKYTHPFYATEITRCNARIALLNQLQNFLDTIETKEVDLAQEIEKVKKMQKNFEFKNDTIIEFCAKHFFEVGLNAKKGE